MRSDGTQFNKHDGLYLFQSVTSGDLDTEVQHLDQNQLSQPSFLNFSSLSPAEHFPPALWKSFHTWAGLVMEMWSNGGVCQRGTQLDTSIFTCLNFVIWCHILNSKTTKQLKHGTVKDWSLNMVLQQRRSLTGRTTAIISDISLKQCQRFDSKWVIAGEFPAVTHKVVPFCWKSKLCYQSHKRCVSLPPFI